MRAKILASALLMAATTASPAFADVITLHGTFKPEHGGPESVSGAVTAKLDTIANTLTYHFKDKNLSGPITAVHLHGPASPDEDGGVIVPILKPYGSKMHGVLHLTAEQVKTVEDGKSYINLHTEKFPSGGARAQLTEK